MPEMLSQYAEWQPKAEGRWVIKDAPGFLRFLLRDGLDGPDDREAVLRQLAGDLEKRGPTELPRWGDGDLHAVIAKLRDENERLKKELGDWKRTSAQSDRTIESVTRKGLEVQAKLRDENERLKRQLSEAERRIHFLSGCMSHHPDDIEEIERLKARLKSAQQGWARFCGDNERLRAENERLKLRLRHPCEAQRMDQTERRMGELRQTLANRDARIKIMKDKLNSIALEAALCDE